MPKGSKSGKSSASSGTRKKQAAKAAKKAGGAEGADGKAAPGQQQKHGPQRGQKKDKKSKKEPKKKVFVPPPKPPQGLPDPLDTLGLASQLPGDLVVLLRKAGKKDVVTRQRALEGLQAWIQDAVDSSAKAEEDETGEAAQKEAALILMLPCWSHLFPRLAMSPTRRLRLLTAQIHRTIVSEGAPTRSELLESPQYIEALLGPWAVLAWDTDAQVARAGRQAWDQCTALSGQASDAEAAKEGSPRIDLTENVETYLSHLSRAISAPLSILQAHAEPAAAASAAATPLNGASTPTEQQRASKTGAPLDPRAGDLRDAKHRDDNVEETVEATQARLAAGALGSLTWAIAQSKSFGLTEQQPDASEVTPAELALQESLDYLLHSEQLWLCFSPPGTRTSGQPNLGPQLPALRLRAWQLVSTLLSERKETLRALLFGPLHSDEDDDVNHEGPSRGETILASAWEERDQMVQRAMMDTIAPLLIAFDSLWGLDDGHDGDEEEDSEDESDDGSEADAEEGAGGKSTLSPTYVGFLGWLSSACGEAPAIGFPAILILASSLRSHLLHLQNPQQAVESFFDHFYGALKTRSLDANPLGARAFLASYCETVVFFVRRTLEGPAEELAEADRRKFGEHIATTQLRRAWRDLVLHSALPAEDRLEGAALSARVQGMSDARIVQELGKAIITIAGNKAAGAAVLDSLLHDMTEATSAAITSSEDVMMPPTKALTRAAGIFALLSANEATRDAMISVVKELSRVCETGIQQAGGARSAVPLEFLSILLRELPPAFVQASALSETMRTISEKSMAPLLAEPGTSAAASALLGSYLPLISEASSRAAVWTQITSTIGSLSDIDAQAVIVCSLHEPVSKVAAADFGGATAALDSFALACISRISESTRPVPVAISKAALLLMSEPAPFIDTNVSAEMLTLAVSKLEYEGRDLVSRAIKGEEIDQESVLPLSALADLLLKYIEQGPEERRVIDLSDSDVYQGVVPVIFNLAYLCDGAVGGISSKAVQLWTHFANNQQAKQLVLDSLQEHLLDILVPLSSLRGAINVLDGIDSIAAILPQASSVDLMAREALGGPIATELSVLDTMIPQDGGEVEEVKGIWDFAGLGPYPRLLWAVQHAAAEDSDFLEGSPWTIKHLAQLAVAAEDALNRPGRSSHLWSGNVSTSVLKRLLSGTTEVLTAVISSTGRRSGPEWHSRLISNLRDPDTVPVDLVARGLVDLKEDGTVTALRALSRLIHGALRFSSADEAATAAWIKFAQSKTSSAPLFATAVAAAAQSEAEGTSAYSRACNEVIAELSAVRAADASTKGLALLRYISVLLPAPESDTIFIPQQRAVFVLQTLQRWITSEEDIAEEINTRIAQLGVALLPIVQDVPGSHFDFFMDLIESNLEVSSLAESETLPCLHQSLRLLITMRDIAATNAGVREMWSERRKESLQVIRGLFLSIDDAPLCHSEARYRCIDLILELVGEVPDKMFSDEHSRHVLHRLLLTPRSDVQMVAYRRISALTMARTSDLVVQLALDKGQADPEKAKEQAKIYRLPVDVLANIANNVPKTLIEERHAVPYRMHGFLLSWLVVLDHFEGASIQLSSRYMEELQKRDLVATTLLPSIFKICDDSIFAEALDPSLWSMEEVFLDHIDITRPSSLQVLAAHLFFRALVRIPTLVRAWWYDLRDKQLSAAVERFTVKHCTPLVAARELAHLGESDALARLQDESMAVKVLSTNEVVATYTVDEHPMEIAIKIPRDFPLHGVEIRDVKRVGVSEAQWRAWILAVQQLITSRNGLIFDALMLFKKNAEAKFAGYEGAECAICYSIINPTDQSLPNKPCKTCKNKFHGQCLYKWVSTSGSSTCPLCRSIL